MTIEGPSIFAQYTISHVFVHTMTAIHDSLTELIGIIISKKFRIIQFAHQMKAKHLI